MPTVEANGASLYFETRGSGPPVIFLHGAGADHRVWAEVTEPLTEDYEVIVLDMRLHGKSGGEPGEPVTIDTYVDDLHGFIGTLDLATPAIVGLSMGGMVAQRYAAEYPDEVRALSTLGAMTTETLSREEWLLEKVAFPVVDRVRNTAGEEYARKLMDAIMNLRPDDVEPSDMDERDRIESAHNDDYPEQSEAQEAAVRDSLSGYGDRSTDYTAITTPFLYLYGEREMSTLQDHAEFVTETVPNGRALEVPNASHHSHVDNPEFVVETLREFLDEHAAGDCTAEPV